MQFSVEIWYHIKSLTKAENQSKSLARYVRLRIIHGRKVSLATSKIGGE